MATQPRGHVATQPHSYEQQDAHELLIATLDILHQHFKGTSPAPTQPHTATWPHGHMATRPHSYEQQDAHEFLIATLDVLHQHFKGTSPAAFVPAQQCGNDMHVIQFNSIQFNSIQFVRWTDERTDGKMDGTSNQSFLFNSVLFWSADCFMSSDGPAVLPAI